MDQRIRVQHWLGRHLLVLGVLIGCAPAAGKVIYVNQHAHGNPDGASWGTAFIDLQSALAVANSGDEVWVAAGTYMPDVYLGDQTKSYQPHDGVILYGGFYGFESSVAERPGTWNLTVLSGDLDENDGEEEPTTAINSLNIVDTGSHHVVIDGFTITGANDRLITGSNGRAEIRHCLMRGGIRIRDGELLVEDCELVTDDRLLQYGAWSMFDLANSQLAIVGCKLYGAKFPRFEMDDVGVTLISQDRGRSVIEDCLFFQGASSQLDISGTGTLRVLRCHFQGSSTVERTGGIRFAGELLLESCEFTSIRTAAHLAGIGEIRGCHFEDTFAGGAALELEADSNITLRNTSFIGNDSTALRGCVRDVIGCRFIHNGDNTLLVESGAPRFINCLYRNNGSCIFCRVPSLTVINCLFDSNGDPRNLPGAFIIEGEASISFSTFVGNRSGGTILGTGPGVIHISNSVFKENSGSFARNLQLSSGKLAQITGCAIQGGRLSCSGSVEWLEGNRDFADEVNSLGSATQLQPGVRTGVGSAIPLDLFDLDADGDVSERLPIDLQGNQRTYAPGIPIGASEFVDSDGDGLPDWWEAAYFGSPTAAEPGQDSDGDGLTNLDEFENTGSDPVARPWYIDAAAGNDSWDGKAPVHLLDPPGNSTGPKKTLDSVLAVIDTGDSVLVAPGVYEEPQLWPKTSDYVLKSAGAAGSVILNQSTPPRIPRGIRTMIGFTFPGRGASIELSHAVRNSQLRDCFFEHKDQSGGLDLERNRIICDGTSLGLNADPASSVGILTNATLSVVNPLSVTRGILECRSAYVDGPLTMDSLNKRRARVELHSEAMLLVSNKRPEPTIIRCNVSGEGTVRVDAGGTLILAGKAELDLSGGTAGGCDVPVVGAPPRLLIDGTLIVQDEATIRNTGVAVRLLQASPGTTIRYNNILAGGDSTGYGGEFFLEVDPDPNSTRRVSVQCNRIVAQGDRYLDLDPDFTIPAEKRPLIQNNRIEVVCDETVGTQGTILELRAYDYGCDPNQPPSATNCAGGPERANLIPWATPDQFDSDAFPANNWVLEKLTVSAGKLLTLTNRQGFDFNGPGHPDCLYVKTLVLEPGAVLNLGGQRLYFGTLLGNVSQVIDTPLLGFSLSNIAMESDNEFSVRLRTRTIDPLDIQPSAPPLIEGVVQRAVLAVHGGVMRMATRAGGAPSSASSVAAKGHFTRASNLEQIVVDFEYQFAQASPDAVMRVYLSDKAGIGESNRLLAEVRPPPPGFPGSVGSNTFATFRGRFPTNQLSFLRGTFVEVELRGADTQVLIDNLDPQVECTHGCRDFNSENTPTKADLLILLAESGQLRTTRTMCLDGNGDGFIDHLDALFWYSQVPCLNGPHPYGRRTELMPPQKANHSPTSGPQIIVLGKDNDQTDLLVPVQTTTGQCASPQQVPCNGEDCDTRAMGLVQHPSGATYVIHALNGIYDAQAGPGSPLLANGMVPCATAECASVDVGMVLPVTDVAFPPGASAADRLYVAPVTVTPTPGGSTFTAVAEITLTGGSASVTRILGANPYDPATQVLDPCLNCTAAQGTCDPICNLQKVREIDVDAWGNVFALVSDASNANSWLVVYNGVAGTPGHVVFRERIATITGDAILAAPAALRLSQNQPYAYVTSALSSSRTQTVARLTVARSAGAQQVTGVTLDAVRSVSIDVGPDDGSCMNCRYVAHPIAIDENRTTGEVYVVGYLGPQYPPDDITRFTNSTPFFTWPYLITFGTGGSWSTSTASVVGLANCSSPTLAWPIAAAFDQATAVAPPPHASSWRSVHTHNGTEISLILNPAKTGNGASGPTVEPRHGGLEKLEVLFSAPVTLQDASAISVIGRTTINGDPQAPVSYATVATLPTSTSLELTFPQPLPDQTCYTISLGNALRGVDGQALAGDTDCLVRSLFGDVNGDGQLVLGDALLVKSRLNWAVAEAPYCDVNCSGGSINLGDCITIRAALKSPVPRVVCP